jgi:acyl-CoA thioesterase YciA
VLERERGSRMTEVTAEPTGALTIRTLAMPADTNPAGDIFGGWVMSQMDIAGAIAAVERAKGRVVTVAVEAMTFIAPVKVGDILCVYTSVDRVGTTSIRIAVEAWVRRNRLDDRVKVTNGRFVYVALGEDGRKRAIPG